MDPNAITPNMVKQRLVGLDMWLDAARKSGVEYDDSTIAELIQVACRQFEVEAQMRIDPVRIRNFDDGMYPPVGETYPIEDEPPSAYERDMVRDYFGTTLNHRPVRKVDRVRVMLSHNQQLITMPTEWIRIDELSGRLWILPVTGAAMVAGVMLQLVNFQIAFGTRDYIPNTFCVDYVVGLPDSWWTQHKWLPLKYVLTEYAAYYVLKDISEAFDAGLLSKIIGGDGMSQQLNYSRFEKRKEELYQSVQRYISNMHAQESPILLGVV